jgi:alpha-glucan,water dikinase
MNSSVSSTAEDNTHPAARVSDLVDDLDRWVQQVANDTGFAVMKRRVVDLTDQTRVAAAVLGDASSRTFRVLLLTDAAGEPWLHWGMAVDRPDEWQMPPESQCPAGSKPFDDRALRSPFTCNGQWHGLVLELDDIAETPRRAINFVLYDRKHDRWLKQDGQDVHLRLPRPRTGGQSDLEALIHRIAEAEVGDHSWTLMHRFSLCRELLEEVGNEPEGLALLLVWLRFSAIRQLSWQRNYNTKPRELAEAQEQLTQQLASLYEPGTRAGSLVRLMLSLVGRGGEGQRVRDQVLEIMHRQGIKEEHGTWLEQWHQKLHNNTTPDDIVICEAYLAFLESHGDAQAYDAALEKGGIDRQRLGNLERPITGTPEFYPDKREALIGEMQQFLKLLKSVHSGQDLDTSIDAAAYAMNQSLIDDLKQLLGVRAETDEDLSRIAAQFTEARRRLSEHLESTAHPRAVRDLLYVDLGLESQLRNAIEGFTMSEASTGGLADLNEPVLSHLLMSEDDPELAVCRDYWRQIELAEPIKPELRMHALAAADRTSRWVRTATDELHQLLQSKAEQLGAALKVERWTIPIFSEEVVRGTLLFVMGRILRRLEPQLRHDAGLGGWQIISPGEATGQLEAVQQLREVQSRTFERPTILLADEVAGDEEIPANVRGVITPAVPDLVSHVAVRARNEHVLVASCLETEPLQSLRGQVGQDVTVRLTPGGEVTWTEADDGASAAPASISHSASESLPTPTLEPGVVLPADFSRDVVGGKALHLAELQSQLPEWVRVPPMMALRFGTFESVLADSANGSNADQYERLTGKVDTDPEQVLPTIRKTLARLTCPAWLRSEIEQYAAQVGLPAADAWDPLWQSIAQVWASQWTDRAYWARRRLGIKHKSLHMAVLIQQVVPADYAFVLHTANPMTGNPDELYGELVLGLGETLVGNDPGRPLAFTADKRGGAPKLINLPSKSYGLYGEGVICRSDSNGEDLAGYAGAGLYDSVMTKPPRQQRLNYVHEPLVWDSQQRQSLLHSLAELGRMVEQVMGSPQDIEGAIHQGEIHLVQTRPQVGL